VRIIQRGTPPEGRKIKASCQRCHTKVEFTAREARLVPDPRDGDYYSVSCPVCHEPINVNVRGRHG